MVFRYEQLIKVYFKTEGLRTTSQCILITLPYKMASATITDRMT